MPNADPQPGPSTPSSSMREYALLIGLVLGCAVLFFFILAHLKHRSGGKAAPQPPSVASPAPKAPGLDMPASGDPSKKAQEPAALPGNEPAGGLSLPERPREVAAFFSPEDSAAGTGPGGATPQSSVDNVVRGKKMYVIDVTGWGVVPPQGFAQEDGAHGTWRPASGDKAGSRILVRSGPACKPSCADQTVSDSVVTRGITGYRRSYTFRCPWVVKYGGTDWKYADFAIIKLESEACVTMTLLSRTPQGRDQATPAFLRMRDSLQPLPQRPDKPTLDGKIEDAQVPLLR